MQDSESEEQETENVTISEGQVEEKSFQEVKDDSRNVFDETVLKNEIVRERLVCQDKLQFGHRKQLDISGAGTLFQLTSFQNVDKLSGILYLGRICELVFDCYFEKNDSFHLISFNRCFEDKQKYFGRRIDARGIMISHSLKFVDRSELRNFVIIYSLLLFLQEHAETVDENLKENEKNRELHVSVDQKFATTEYVSGFNNLVECEEISRRTKNVEDMKEDDDMDTEEILQV